MIRLIDWPGFGGYGSSMEKWVLGKKNEVKSFFIQLAIKSFFLADSGHYPISHYLQYTVTKAISTIFNSQMLVIYYIITFIGIIIYI